MESQETLKNKIIQRAWQDAEFKKALLEDPKKVLEKEYNIVLPEAVEIKVLEETEQQFYLVIPMNPTLAKVDEDSSVMWS